MIPEYKDAKMTPFKTNQEQDAEKKEKDEAQFFKDYKTSIREQTAQPDTLLEFKLNQPKPVQQKPLTQQIYPSAYVPVANPYYPNATNVAFPWQYTPNNVPIIKNYNISLGGPNDDVTKVANLYEDMLPNVSNVPTNTFNTVKERMVIHHYVRSIFIKTGDGEEVLIGGGNAVNTNSEITNLLSHIKLLEINPYHHSRQTDNPYRTLAENFVMYRSCYPIKMGNYNVVECSKSSIGMNIRIYLLSKYDDDINSSAILSRYNSDIWRELDYYQYIRDEIIKPNISPNFIALHSHYMTKNTGINFDKFNTIRGKIDIKNLNISKMNADVKNNLYVRYIKDYYFNDKDVKVTFDDLIKENIIPVKSTPRSVTDIERRTVTDKRVDELIISNKLVHYMDSDKCLVMLSEAPTQNFLDWATRTYQIGNGPIKKMVQNGYHDDKLWESIYFQLLLSMLIMFDKKIMFTDFSLNNNVYIKDLKQNDQNIGIWKYIYDGIEYYVPNYGYLLMIDSNFAEINGTTNKLSSSYDPSAINFRIKSTLLKDKNDNGEIYKLCVKNMIRVFGSDNLGREFTNYGGVPPTPEFIKKLDTIVSHLRSIENKYLTAWNPAKEQEFINEIKNIPIDLTTQNVFNMVHSRVGMPVKDQEKSYIGDRFDGNAKYGSIVLRKISLTFSTFAIFLGKGTIDGQYSVLTTHEPVFGNEDKKIFIKQNIDQNSLVNYFGQPEHSYEPGKQYNVLESYLICLHQ